MVRSPIKAHTTAAISNLLEQADSFKNIEHKVLKGKLRELLVSKFLSKYLIKDLGIGTGIIINQKEEQSKETDVIIYDKRILPPFIHDIQTGFFPAESVIATIEVKSWLRKKDIKEYSKTVTSLYDKIYFPKSSIYGDYLIMKPLCSIVGFYDDCNFNYDNTKENRKDIRDWMIKNTYNLFGVCLLGEFSWLRIMLPVGVTHLRSDYHEQTKAFFAILLDNIRTRANERYIRVFSRHSDWLSLYLRDQKMEKFF